MEGPFRLTLTGDLKNFGNTPARNIIAKTAIRVADDSPPFRPETLELPVFAQILGPVAPGDTGCVNFKINVILSERLILQEIQNIVVVVIITYDTIGLGKGETRSADFVVNLPDAARCVAATGGLEQMTFTRAPTGNDMS